MIGLSLLLGGTALAALAATPCAALAKFTLKGHDIKITRAEDLPAGLPPAAPNGPPGPRVEGVLDQRTGRNGKPYAIESAIALPPNWTGRFFFEGGGGLNGVVTPPVGARFITWNRVEGDHVNAYDRDPSFAQNYAR